MAKKTAQQNTTVKPTASEKRPPVVAVMGHIDHGKSTLLDYIRKSNVVDTEAGGITQRISAYEVTRKSKSGTEERVTFIDTPGHAAFSGMRERGATTADICILVVSSEDGVKPQTVEAYKQIKTAGVPFIVAITKIDKPTANVERAKISLAENEIYLEGYGGDISYVPVSAKSGDGIDDLLELILLTAEVAEFKGDRNALASGSIIEAHRDPKKGISATLIVKDGSLGTGQFVACGSAWSPTRMLEDFAGKKIVTVSFSSPLRVIGWNEAPQVGGQFVTFASKSDLEDHLETIRESKLRPVNNPGAPIAAPKVPEESDKASLPLIIKADVLGSAEAIEKELSKLGNERIAPKIILASIGDITESDIKVAGGGTDTVVLGFNVRMDSQAKAMVERLGISYQSFDIIYKLIEWVDELIKQRTPKVAAEEIVGKAKILKYFSAMKDKQIVGGKVIDREIGLGHIVKIVRRETTIGQGVIRELQQAKVKTSTVKEGFEFGAMIDSKIELAPGDVLEDFVVVEK
ncbi:MAG: translation initiation factor IF-2 [bacterium]|nr:translation initiation factor IF-2 [bacterium]